jgi:hypothetical protein
LARDEDARRIGDTVRDNDLLDFVPESFFDGGAEVVVLRYLLLALLLLLLGLLELKTLLRHTDKLLAIEFLELCDSVFVDGVDEKQYFEALLLEDLEERRVTDSNERFTGEIVDSR